MIVGLIGITEGQVIIQGTDLQENFERAMQHVGAIIENPEMYKFLSGHKNLVHYAKMRPGITKERIDEVVSLVRGWNGAFTTKSKPIPLVCGNG